MAENGNYNISINKERISFKCNQSYFLSKKHGTNGKINTARNTQMKMSIACDTRYGLRLKNSLESTIAKNIHLKLDITNSRI